MPAAETKKPGISVRLEVLTKTKAVRYSGDYVKEKLVLGRILSADLRVDDPSVSRIHALLEMRGNTLLLTDLASTHGTFVNGKKVIESKVKFGDTIRLGLTNIKVLEGTGEQKPAQMPTSEERPTFDSEETQIHIDRRLMEELDRRDKGDRRHHDAFPDEKRLNDRRGGERRIEQRSGKERRTKTEKVAKDRRAGKDRREGRDWERRIGQRRRDDRRVFDITSLERRIEDRRFRDGDEDLLPEELEAAFKQPEHARELEVTVLWGDHILDVSNYADPTIINVGENSKNNYVIPSLGIPDEFPLITIEEDGTAYLAFTENMTGTIRARDKIYRVHELKEEKFIRRYGGYYIMPLRRDDFAKLSIGTVNFFILYVKPAPRIGAAPLFDRDKLFLKSLIGSFLLMLLMFIGLALIPEPKPVTIEMIPERFARIVIKKRPKIADVKIPNAKAKEKGSKAAKGSKPKKKKGKAKAAKKKPTKKAAAKKPTRKKAKKTKKKPVSKARRKIVDAKKAKSVGILKALGGSRSKLKKLLDKDSGTEVFDKSVSAYKGQGARGRGKVVKGVSTGGGGKTIGISGPTTGVGSGVSGQGIGEGVFGPGRLGKKGEHTVSVITENVQVLSGLPKDVINAVVQRHRGEIRQCYEAARQRNPSLRGKVVINFKIQPSGVVSQAGITSSTVGDRRLHNCITSRVRSWRFPQPEAPVVTEVSAYPFFLNPGN